MEIKENIGANNNNEKEQTSHWWRTQSATMSLLKHAYKKIDHAEQEISRQERRIEDLEKLASTDELTGLYNRRGFMMEFKRNIYRLKRNLKNESDKAGGLFILFDLDKFKYINDTYGHLAGDKCLQLVAKTLMDMTRDSDTAARFGGDEFVMFLPEMSEKNASKKVDSIREKINTLTLEWKGKIIPIQTSIGMHYYTVEEAFAETYHAADKALYIDKQKIANESN